MSNANRKRGLSPQRSFPQLVSAADPRLPLQLFVAECVVRSGGYVVMVVSTTSTVNLEDLYRTLLQMCSFQSSNSGKGNPGCCKKGEIGGTHIEASIDATCEPKEVHDHCRGCDVHPDQERDKG